MADVTEGTSILTSVKKGLSLEESETHFDDELIMHINSVFTTLNQLAVGPEIAFEITGDTETWEDFIGNIYNINSVKTYMVLSVRLIFDPPATSFVITAFENKIKEYEWRLNTEREVKRHPNGI